MKTFTSPDSLENTASQELILDQLQILSDSIVQTNDTKLLEQMFEVMKIFIVVANSGSRKKLALNATRILEQIAVKMYGK